MTKSQSLPVSEISAWLRKIINEGLGSLEIDTSAQWEMNECGVGFSDVVFAIEQCSTIEHGLSEGCYTICGDTADGIHIAVAIIPKLDTFCVKVIKVWRE